MSHSTTIDGSMIEYYLDDSGEPTDPSQTVVVVAGLAMSSDKADELNSNWTAVLKDYDVPYFHCREAMHRTDSYDSWTKDKVDELYRRLLATISSSAPLIVISVVDLAAFRDIFGQGDPYQLCLHTCTSCVIGTIPPNSTRLRFVVDKKPKANGEAGDLFEEFQGAFPDLFAHPEPLTFESAMRSTPGLQAADIVAWEARKRAADYLKGSDRLRASFSSLLQSASVIQRFHDRGSLIHLLEQHK